MKSIGRFRRLLLIQGAHMKRSTLLSLIFCVGLVSVAQGQEGRPVEERVRSGGRGSAAEPDPPAMTIVLSQENQTAEPRRRKVSGSLRDSLGRPPSGRGKMPM